MIDLKDFAFFTLNEGILDDIEDQMVSGDDTMNDDQLTKWAAANKNSSKPYWRKTKKGYVIKGNFKLNDIEDTYTGPMIKQVIGNLVICNSELTSLEGIFSVDCEISGTFTIEDNPQLTSTKGCPLKVGSLTIANNKKLKNIELTPFVMNNAYISGNGKKFKKEDLEKIVHVGKHIFCSEEPQDVDNIVSEDTIDINMINEAFKAPQLKLVADAIKKISNNVPREDKASIYNLRQIKWDKIDSADITEYDKNDPEAYKMCRKILSHGTSNADYLGIIIILNKDGEVTHIVNNGGTIISLRPDPYERRRDKYTFGRYGEGYRNLTYLIDRIKQLADTILIVDLSEGNEGWVGPEGRYSTRSQRNTRIHLKKDAVALDRMHEKEYTTQEIEAAAEKGSILRRYNNSIALENVKRYKRIIEEIRAKAALENNNRLEKINDKIDECMNRYLKLVRKVTINPSKYEKVKYDFGKLGAQLGYNNSYNNTSGLMTTLTEYLKTLTEKEKYIGDQRSEFDKMYNDPKAFTNKLQKLEDKMESQINVVEELLKTFEAI